MYLKMTCTENRTGFISVLELFRFILLINLTVFCLSICLCSCPGLGHEGVELGAVWSNLGCCSIPLISLPGGWKYGIPTFLKKEHGFAWRKNAYMEDPWAALPWLLVCIFVINIVFVTVGSLI